jgi:hypothetical protein
MNNEEQEAAATLLRRLLDALHRGDLGADGPAAVAVARRLEGALLTLEAMIATRPERGAQPNRVQRER